VVERGHPGGAEALGQGDQRGISKIGSTNTGFR
jgi:hypothetical protein